MRICVFSDVHGNLPSLEAMFVYMKPECIDLFVSLGDVVNYGPWSNECVDLLSSQSNIVKLKGNHENAYILGSYIGNKLTESFFNVCFEKFDRMKEIKNYQEFYHLKDIFFVHTIDDRYIFPDTDLNINQHTFIGHSHTQFLKTFNKYKLCNVGSVGQNRADLTQSNFVILDTCKKKYELISIESDINKTINEMKKRKYPQDCINYYINKI